MQHSLPALHVALHPWRHILEDHTPQVVVVEQVQLPVLILGEVSEVGVSGSEYAQAVSNIV